MHNASFQVIQVPHRKNARSYGLGSEGLVVQYLKKNNYIIIDRNFIIRGAEIDIIAQKGEQVHFIEVKSSAVCKTDLTELITIKKQLSIAKAARSFLFKNKLETIGQFDVALVYKHRDVIYLENAFYADV